MIVEDPDRTKNTSLQAGGDYLCLKCVTSRGGFVVFVALQGERGNAHVKVGTVSPLDTKGPPHVATGGL